MPKGTRSKLTESVAEALGESLRGTPAGELALVYAAQIDNADHVKLALDKAARTVRGACLMSADALKANDALDQIMAVLSAVSVTSDLGPKLLATLDALLLTPKAKQAGQGKASGAPGAQPANPLEALRKEQDELARRRANRNSAS